MKCPKCSKDMVGRYFCRRCGWQDEDYDPSPVEPWEVTEGTSAAERDELAWRQKEELGG